MKPVRQRNASVELSNPRGGKKASRNQKTVTLYLGQRLPLGHITYRQSDTGTARPKPAGPSARPNCRSPAACTKPPPRPASIQSRSAFSPPPTPPHSSRMRTVALRKAAGAEADRLQPVPRPSRGRRTGSSGPASPTAPPSCSRASLTHPLS